jgi:hypothetical protein
MNSRGNNVIPRKFDIERAYSPDKTVPAISETGLIEPPELEKDPGYWKDDKPERVVKYPGTARNASCPFGSSIKDVMGHNMLEKEREDPFIRLVRLPEVYNNR